MNSSSTAAEQRRLQILLNHISGNQDNVPMATEQSSLLVQAAVSGGGLGGAKKFKPMGSMSSNEPDMGRGLVRDHERLKKWNGWGYKDTEFLLLENGDVRVGGTRYGVSGEDLPKFREFWETQCGLDMTQTSPCQTLSEMKKKIPAAQSNERFMRALQRGGSEGPTSLYKNLSQDDENRLLHGHGHSCQEIFALRYGKFHRIPDLVLYVADHQQVERLVKLVTDEFATEVMLVPYGGGTTVSQALLCPDGETRFIVAVDMQEMNRIKWIDMDNMLCCIEAGCTGIDIEQKLAKHGVTIGMEPDSYEFSTMGGWVATRASGMMKNTYGNIEDMVVATKMVTTKGTVEIGCTVSRKSTGPDITNMVIGSEGIFGIITEAVVKIKKIPAEREYGAIVFPNFALGVAFFRELAENRIFPTSIRLLDNMQFKFGQSLKLKAKSMFEPMSDWIKQFFLFNIKGLDPDQLCACTMLITGETKEEVEQERRRILNIASKYSGIDAGAEAGKNGYLLTYVIAYLRDYGFNFWFMAESFETCVPWANVVKCCANVTKRIVQAAEKRGVEGIPWCCSRVSQIYDAGCCCYFYFGFSFKGLKDPVRVYSEIEAEAREEILAHGGSLSHHHGVGRLRAKWYRGEAVSDGAFHMVKSIKQGLDPNNIFGLGNMGITDGHVEYDTSTFEVK